MAKKSVRNMKVCGQSGYQYKTIPVISKVEDEQREFAGVSQMVAEGVKKYGN